jgi:peptide deformylase
MILPIIAYGDPVLKKVGEVIQPTYPKLKELITNMYETMYNAHGVGLAAPQIGLSIRLFVVDGAPFEEEEVKDFKKVFINPTITHEEGEYWSFNEGCLSIPEVREDIERLAIVHISYYDEAFNFHENEVFSGLSARIIQHEYDHIEGKLFTDHLSGLRRRLLKKRLADISKGKVDIQYKMRFPAK